MLVEFHALRDQFVHVRRFTESLMPSDIAPPQIVRHDEQNVRR
jgi:hypothetical protein